MYLNERQLKALWKLAGQELKDFPYLKNRDVFIEILECIEEKFGDDINLAYLAIWPKDYEKQKTNFLILIRALLKSQKEPDALAFDRVRFYHYCEEVKKAFPSSTLRQPQARNYVLGIQEKFLMNVLTDYECLIDLDMERMISFTNSQDRIKITRFDITDIGIALHFARERKIDEIGFLVKKVSKETVQGIHWFALTVKINQNNKSINYRIEDSFPISDEQQQEYMRTVEAAIAYNAISIEDSKKVVQAYPGWKIHPGFIRGEETQPDAYYSGYRAFQHLCENSELHGNNKVAILYAKGAHQSELLYASFFRTQIENLPEENRVTSAQAQPFFDSFLDESKDKNKQPQDGKEKESARAGNAKVSQKLNEYRAGDHVQSFPGPEILGLTVADYWDYFTELNQYLVRDDRRLKALMLSPCDETCLDALKSFYVKNPNFRIESINLDLKSGIDPEVFLFKLQSTLHILSNTSLSLISFSYTRQCLDESGWERCVRFITDRNISVEIELPVEYQKSDLQRRIDKAVSKNKKEKATQKARVAVSNIEKAQKQSRVVRAPRTRGRDVVAGISIELAQEQEEQIEIETASDTAVKTDQASAGGDSSKVMTYNDFRIAVFARQFNIPASCYLISTEDLKTRWNTWFGHIEKNGKTSSNPRLSGVTGRACEKLLQYADQFKLGIDFTRLPAGFVEKTDLKDTTKIVLDYDEYQAGLHKASSLAVNCEPPVKLESLPYELYERILKNFGTEFYRYALSLDQGEYDREAVILFRRHCSTLAMLSQPTQTILWNHCFKDGKFSIVEFDFILSNLEKIAEVFPRGYDKTKPACDVVTGEGVAIARSYMNNPPKMPNLLMSLLAGEEPIASDAMEWCQKLPRTNITLNALVRVYGSHGEVGLSQLFQQWAQCKPQVLQDLFTGFFSRLKSFEILLTPEYQNAIKIIESFDPQQYTWWSALAQQHCAGNSMDDLPSCVIAFQEFYKEISKQKLVLTSSVDFHDALNMKVVMSRILLLLSSAKQEDRSGVWSSITGVSFQSTGAIWAATHGQCDFVVPEMQCTPEKFYLSDTCSTGYKTVFWNKIATWEDWHVIALEPVRDVLGMASYVLEERKWGKVATQYYFSKDPFPSVKLNFFRFLAGRPRNLPLLFYQQALRVLEQKLELVTDLKFRSILFSRLAAVLAAATTLRFQVSDDSPEKVLAQWDSLLNYIINPTLPYIPTIPFSGISQQSVRENVQEELSNILFGFLTVTALKDLNELFSEVNAQIASMNIRNRNVIYEDLKERCDRFETIVKYIGGNALSQGRRFRTKDKEELTQFINLCWGIYGLDKKRYEAYARKSNINRGYSEADRSAKYLVILISTFNIKTLEECEKYFQIFDKLTTKPGNVFRDKYVFALLMDVLMTLAGVSSNSVQGRLLNIDYLIEILIETKRKVDGNPSLSKQVDDNEFSKARMQILGDWLLELFPDSLTEDHVRSVMFYGRERESVQKQVDALFIDQPQELRRDVNIFLSKYASDLSKDPSLLSYLKNIFNTLNVDQRVKFVKTLDNEKILQDSNYAELCEVCKIISESSKNIVSEFMYLCEQDEAKTTGALLKAAVIYLRKIVPFLPSLPGLSKFEALPLATSILLRENKGAIGRDPNLMTSNVRLWEEIIKVVESSEKVPLEEFEETMSSLCERVPDKESCQSLLKLLEEAKDIKEMTKKTSRGILVSIVKVVDKITEAMGVEKKPPPPPAYSMGLVALALSESQKNRLEEFKYPATFLQIMLQISDLTKLYSIIRAEYLGFVSTFVARYRNEVTPLIEATWYMLTSVEAACRDIADPEVMRSLLFWFSQEESSPQALLDLFEKIKHPQIRKTIFSLIAKLLDNDLGISVENIEELQRRMIADPNLLKKVESTYRFAPYPSLGTFLSWLNEPRTFETKREEYRRVPCPRDDLNNGFKIDEARKQSENCVGIQFSEDEFNSLEAMTGLYRDATIEELLSQLDSYREKEDPDLVRLLALAAELLYRAKGTPAEGDRKANSFEINTTQYLAILAELKGGEHVTSGIGTSEGKSRIMMIVNACQFARGKTDDFSTSDVVLAKRDFLSAQAFFKLIRAKSSLIYARSSFDIYNMDGINYSDSTNLSLYRNKARSLGLIKLVLNPNPRLRSFTLDEADTLYYDKSEMRCNYSGESDETIRGMEWVYPLLIQFLRQNDPKVWNAFYKEVELCTDLFLEFARARCASKDFERLQSLSRAQLETWQTSADVAMKLKYNVNYIVRGDTLLNTSEGPKMGSDILLIAEDRVSPGAKYSDGVQQCLTAYLNILRTEPSDGTALWKAIITFQHDFHMEPEKKIIYSSTSQDLLDDYEQGSVKAVTATPGALIEQNEAALSIAHKGPDSQFDMRFIGIPRHKGLKRVDRPPIVTRSHAEKLKRISTAIYEALMNGQAIAFIAKNDEEGLKLYNELLALGFDTKTLQRIHTGLSEKEEEGMKKIAGRPGVITISTGMIGRGVDIEMVRKNETYRYLEEQYPDDEFIVLGAREGLEIRPTFLPTTRGMEQFFGRSGRKGQPGGAQLILELSDLPEAVDLDSPDLESKIASMQIWMDRFNQCKRLILNTYGKFRSHLNIEYFGKLGNKGINRYWAKFQTQADQAWKETWTHIRDHINLAHPDPRIIQPYLDAYQQRVENFWRELCGNVKSDPSLTNFSVNDTVETLTLDHNTINLMMHFDPLDSLAPIQFKHLFALSDQPNGWLKAFEKFQEYLSDDAEREAMIGIAEEKANESTGSISARYAIMLEFALSEELEPLPRVLDAYCKINRPSDHHALIILQFLAQFIRSRQISFLADVVRINQEINRAIVVPNSPYLTVLMGILKIGFEHQPYYRLGFFNTENDVTQDFFKAFKLAYFRLTRPRVVPIEELPLDNAKGAAKK